MESFRMSWDSRVTWLMPFNVRIVMARRIEFTTRADTAQGREICAAVEILPYSF